MCKFSAMKISLGVYKCNGLVQFLRGKEYEILGMVDASSYYNETSRLVCKVHVMKFKLGDRVKSTTNQFNRYGIIYGHVYTIVDISDEGSIQWLGFEGINDNKHNFHAKCFKLYKLTSNDIEWLDAVQQNFKE